MQKLNKLRKYMKENEVDVCIFKHAENICLFSGYWPRNGNSYYVVGQSSAPMIVAPEGVQEDPTLGRIKDIRQFGFLKVKDGNHYENIKKILVEYKNQNAIDDGAKVAMDIGFDVIGVPVCSGEIATIGEATLTMVKQSFATDHINSAKDSIVEIRGIKEAEDILKLEISNELGLMACNYFQEIVKAGEREIDIAAKTEAFFAMKAAGYKGSRYGKAWVQISSGTKTGREAWFCGVVSEARSIESGDMVMLEMGAVVDGYWCDLTSVCVAGDVSPKQQEVMDIVKEAQLKAIKAMKPGAVAKDVYQVAMDHISSKGYGDNFVHGLGHGLGFNYHEAMPGLGPSSEDVLEEGMVMSCEPGIYMDGEFGVRWESNILITATGSKILGE